MNRDLTLATGRTAAAGEHGVAEAPRHWLDAAPTTPPVWRHTLILTGRLDASSAHEVQEEIECLFQEGVTSLVLDLRRLDVIELGAMRAVASLSGLYKRRGISVSAIGGRASLHHALMEAEATSERIAPRRSRSPVPEAFHAWSTEMIKQL